MTRITVLSPKVQLARKHMYLGLPHYSLVIDAAEGP